MNDNFFSDFRVSCKYFISETCHTSEIENNIVMKLGPDIILKYPSIGIYMMTYIDFYFLPYLDFCESPFQKER